MKTLFSPHHHAEVVQRIKRVRPDSERQWGSMTPHQMVCHLTDGFRTMLGDREAKDMSSMFTRTLLRFVAMSTPMPWPKGVMTMPELNQDKGGTPPEGFEEDLDRLVSSITDWVIRLDYRTMSHPVFGKMSRGEWGRWAYRHVDHHARQFGL